ncbi:hypothetical protein B0T17DRAFT_611303 [Bombardia bombarda]|uniref:Uncharacterized protein n=1 Tax=Bombardia bombarda TaxID=252184 RepID=A0AA39XHT5_9PEZI|nr:hypothetical protein B0T17DRAFT_611303 [Bombardia bombarda]
MSLEAPDYGCSAHITTDNEIGGPGVAASFIFVSWLTIILALFPAFQEAKKATRQFNSWLGYRRQPSKTDAKRGALQSTSHALNSSPSPSSSPGIAKIIQLLGHVCDIQVVTGLAIMVAGLAQWTHISYYHEQLVTLYFQLTLDSFWAARINYMDMRFIADPSKTDNGTNNSWKHHMHIQTRRCAVLITCVLATIWQFRIYFRENMSRPEGESWNDGPSGPCYRYLDQSSPLFALVFRASGLILFSFALATTTLLPVSWMHRPTMVFQQVGRTMETLFTGLCLCIAFLLRQWLAVWSYGDGFYPLIWLVYFGLNVWNTLAVVSLMVLNHDLVDHGEFKWGFGQILPLVLTLSLVFVALDVFSR